MPKNIDLVEFGKMMQAVEALPEKIADKISPLHEELKNHTDAFAEHIRSDERHAMDDANWKANKEKRDAQIEKYFWFASIIWGVFMFLMAPVYVIIVTHLLESWFSGQPISLVSFLGLDNIL